MTDFGRVQKHASSHESGGSDELDISGLTPKAHAASHQSGGSDEIDATGLTGVPVGCLLSLAAQNWHFRHGTVIIKNGTAANTLKCELGPRWNGDTIAETDNVAKDATTGHWTLDANGYNLDIENAGLSGAVWAAWGSPLYLKVGVEPQVVVRSTPTDIRIVFKNPVTGGSYDITVLVDTGDIYIDIFYITNA